MNLRNIGLAAAMTAALTVGGCSTIEGWFGGSGDPATTILNAAKKADGAAHDLHAAAAQTADAAAKSGVLHGSAAATVQSYLDQSEAWLVKADVAIAAGDAATANSDLSQAAPLTAQAQALATQH